MARLADGLGVADSHVNACPHGRPAPCPVRFGAPARLCRRARLTRPSVRRTGQVPTRDQPVLDDPFNGLVWQRFPRAKAQHATLRGRLFVRQGVGAVRGWCAMPSPCSDENGAPVAGPARAVASLCWPATGIALFRRSTAPLWAVATLESSPHARWNSWLWIRGFERMKKI